MKLDGGVNARLDKTIEHLDIKGVKKALGLKDEDLARMFGYKNVLSYRNAKDGKKRLDSGIVELYSLIKSKADCSISNESIFSTSELKAIYKVK